MKKDICSLNREEVTLISRWKICKSCSCFSPFTSCTKIVQMAYYGNLVPCWVCFVIWMLRSPLLANSITMLPALTKKIPQWLAWFINESLFIANNVRMSYGGQNANLVQSILLLFVWQIGHLDSFEGVNLSILLTFDPINCGVCPFSQFCQHLKFLKRHLSK